MNHSFIIVAFYEGIAKPKGINDPISILLYTPFYLQALGKLLWQSMHNNVIKRELTGLGNSK